MAGKELLPQSYKIRLTHKGATNETTQNVATDPVYIFQTGKVNCATCTKYYAGGWQTFSDGMQMLPGEYKFRFNDGTPETKYTIVAGADNNIP